MNQIEPCVRCQSVSHFIIFTCNCEKLIICSSCGRFEALSCDRCKQFPIFSLSTQESFEKRKFITCEGCGCFVPIQTLAFHFRNVCPDSPKKIEFRQKYEQSILFENRLKKIYMDKFKQDVAATVSIVADFNEKRLASNIEESLDNKRQRIYFFFLKKRKLF